MTVAPVTVGAPTASLPPLLTSSTRSNVTGLPASTSRRSISSLSPAATRYCLLPVSKTAYIKLVSRKGSHIEPDFQKLSTPDFWQTGLFPSAQPAFLFLDFTGQQFFR